MISIQLNNNRYEVKSQKLKRFHDGSNSIVYYYGYKNGNHVRGTTSSISEKESLILLLGLDNIILNEETLNAI